MSYLKKVILHTFRFILLFVLISDILAVKQAPRNLQKILKGFDQNGRFAEMEASITSESELSSESKQDQFTLLIRKVHEYSTELQKQQEAPDIRRVKKGVLSDIYPKAQRVLADKAILERRKDAYDVMLVTKLYRFCLYPVSHINAYKYCEKYMKTSMKQYAECKHLNCINCCNHLLLIMKYITSQSIVSEVLNIHDDSGYNKIRQYVTPQTQKQCRYDCKVVYPMETPVIVEAPPNDPELGTSAENPGKTCIDIHRNGGPRKDGIYWVQPQESIEPFSIYCDQNYDGGGWGLFFNYNHKPMQDVDINDQDLPQSTDKDDCHIPLEQMKFTSLDVMELRFFCQTSDTIKGQEIYMSFKSTNADLMKVALTGDQRFSRPQSYKEKSIPLTMNSPPYSEMKYSNANKNGQSGSQNQKGMFWDTPFSSELGAWTVKGNNKLGQKWECGDYLDPTTNGNNFQTKHQVWFRGVPPDEAAVETRYLNKLGKTQRRR